MSDIKSDLKKISDYLNEAGTFYLTTIDENQPKCRPVSFHMEIGDKIYFGVGTFKEVYKQMTSNSRVEICACTGNKFLRYYGTAVFDFDPALSDKAFEVLPMLRSIYNEETGFKMGMFYLDAATAEFRSMIEVEETIHFND